MTPLQTDLRFPVNIRKHLHLSINTQAKDSGVRPGQSLWIRLVDPELGEPLQHWTQRPVFPRPPPGGLSKSLTTHERGPDTQTGGLYDHRSQKKFHQNFVSENLNFFETRK